MILLKVHESDAERVVALCDSCVLGECFSEGDVVLAADRDFFGGKECSVEEAVDAVRSADSAVIVGNEAVGKMAERRVVTAFRTIGGIKFAHVYRL